MTLQHVSLEICRDAVPAEVEFWALLGFTPVEPAGTLSEVAAWVQRGATQIHLLFDEDTWSVDAIHQALAREIAVLISPPGAL